jgi:hypothetical protein
VCKEAGDRKAGDEEEKVVEVVKKKVMMRITSVSLKL